jgi:hypothetical protein
MQLIAYCCLAVPPVESTYRRILPSRV